MIDHATSNSGLVFPVNDLVPALEKLGVDTLVDGAHAPGMLTLNLNRLQPAYYTGNLHKWVCAPKGAAFLWVRPDRQSDLQPPVISHGNNTPRPGYNSFQDRFDWPGTFDPSAWFCVGAALDFMGGLLPGGWPELRRRNHGLAVAARRLLCRQLEVEPPCPESMLGSMATIPLLPRRFQGEPKAAKIDVEQLDLYDGTLFVERTGDSKAEKVLHGLTRSVIHNMVTGVLQGYQKVLEIVGVGYRAQVPGSKIVLSLGYSQPIEFQLPESVKATVDAKQTTITIMGIDKQLLGQVAADLKALRSPDSYKGKGIRYSGELLKLKAGKTGKK